MIHEKKNIPSRNTYANGQEVKQQDGHAKQNATTTNRTELQSIWMQCVCQYKWLLLGKLPL